MVNKITVTKGQRFNYLRIIKEIPVVGKGRRVLCKCDCGNVKEIDLYSITRGQTLACGCYNAIAARERNTKHGFRSGTLIEKKLYNVWSNMHKRCYNKENSSYAEYGNRGIKVDSLWHGQQGLVAFVTWAKEHDYKTNLELDRRNNDKGYSPNNCRFVTHKRNTRNMRKTIMIIHPKTDKRIALIDYYEERPRKVNYDRFRIKYHAGKYPHLQAA